jgi:hypothetical protein
MPATKKPKPRKQSIAEIRRRLRDARAYHKLIEEHCERVQRESKKALAAKRGKS